MVADLVRGKRVEEALDLLAFTPKRAADPLRKLIASAHANAGKGENLMIKEIKVDEGTTLYRRRPRSRGMANPIRKRTSHISIILSEAKPKKVKVKTAKKAEKKPEEK